MRDDLLGYLLGALEPDEMRRVEAALRADPALRAELDQWRAALRPLAEAEEIFEPPADLVSNVMAQIPARDVESTGPVQDAAAAGGKTPLAAAAGIAGMSSGAGASSGTSRSSGWRGRDALASCAAAALLAGLVLPGILRQRAAARSAGCQSQLRETGMALVEYLMLTPDRRFPQLEVDGPESFAGRYSVLLRDVGLMPRDRPLWCPSLEVPPDWRDRVLPTSARLRAAEPAELAVYQQGAGGHYAYSLGVREEGRYAAPKFAGRERFAILADAPIYTLGGWSTAHEGRGFNILFEDGHVRFMDESAAILLGDHPFLNRSGDVEAGLDPNDASLAPSHTPPFTLVRQPRPPRLGP